MSETSNSLQLDAQWRDDCQGKKDYDGEILSISSRYWPRGGGMDIFDFDTPELGLQGNDMRPEVKPSAHSSLMLRYKDSDGDGDDLTLAEAEFEAETQEEVQAQVEAWAQKQMDRAVALLRNEFNPKE